MNNRELLRLSCLTFLPSERHDLGLAMLCGSRGGVGNFNLGAPTQARVVESSTSMHVREMEP